MVSQHKLGTVGKFILKRIRLLVKSNLKAQSLWGQFKENRGLGCPHVAFWHYTRDDNDTYAVVLQRNVANTPPPGDCVVVGRKSLISIDEMRGKWTRFEFFIKWSLTNTGEAEGYVNGQRVFSYSGPNCFVDCDKFSNFRYGIYFANQRGGVKLRPLNVFYKNVKIFYFVSPLCSYYQTKSIIQFKLKIECPRKCYNLSRHLY